MPYSLTLPNGFVVNNIPDDVPRGQALENLKTKMPDAFPAPPGIGEQLLGLPGEIGKGFVRGLTVDPASGIASLGYTGARAAGADMVPFEQTGVGQALGRAQTALAPSDEGLITQFGSGLGSLLSFIPGGLLKGGIGLATKLTQAGGVGSEEARARAEEARVLGEADATAGQQFVAQLGGTGVGFSELLPLKFLTEPIEQILRGVPKSQADLIAPTLFNTGQRMLVTGGIEGFQEGMANIAQDLIAKGIYNPNLEVGESALGDAAMGASVGAFAQGAIDLATRGKRRQLYEQVKEQEELAKQAEEQRIAAERQALLDAEERQKQQQAMQALGAGPQIDPETGRPILLLGGPAPEVNLQDPLGVRFGTEDLGPKVVSGLNRARKEKGLPPTQQFTIEDLVEAGSEKDAPLVSEMLARKIGYDPSVQVSPQSIFDLALSKNIDVETPGFADFLRRTTGSPDVASMTAPQLFAAQQSLSALPNFTEQTQLPTGSQATSFDDKTYKKTVDGLKRTVLNSGPLGRSQVIEEIKGFSGLTETRDAERLLDTALRRGDLGASPTRGTQGTSINISLPTLPGIGGPDVRRGDYMDSEVTGYEVVSDDGKFKQTRPTMTAAENLAATAEQSRLNTVNKLTEELNRTQLVLGSNQEKLAELDQIGEKGTQYKKIESNIKNLESKITRLNEKVQSASQPLQIKAKQTPRSRAGFTLFENGQPVGTYPTQEDAEIAAVRFRTDEELDGIINAVPRTTMEGALEQPFGEQPVQRGTVRSGMARRLYDEAVKEKDRRYRSQAGLPPPAAPVKIKITGDAQAAAERLRASGITVRFMPEVEKEIPEINKRLRAVLDKLGLKDIRLNIVDSLKAPGYVIYGRDGKPAAMFLKVPPGSPEYAKTMATIAQARAQGLRVEEDVFSANGSYAAKLIEIALDSKEPIRAARHEAIHALKELGFFTPQQWAVLERKAKSEWLKKYNIEGSGYGSLSKEGQIEEAIADAFSDFDQETPPTGQIGILFNKVKKFFEALGNAFRGSGFQTASDVFTLVEEGRLTGTGSQAISQGDRFSLRTIDTIAGPTEGVADETGQVRGAGPDELAGRPGATGDTAERIGDRGGRDQGRGLAPLEGAPVIQGATGPDANLVSVAERYAQENEIPYRRQGEYVDVDPQFSGRVARAYDAMIHDPQSPAVKEAYADLIRQTRAQYDALVNDGYQFTFFDSATDPYGGNPFNAMRDLRANKRMAVYGTYDGYGTEGITGAEVANNPMLEDTGLRWPDQTGTPRMVTANDLFRAVHDAFGHGLEGAGFRARGEENAFQAHARLFTGPALGALASETRGQNSWLNYGPYGEQNRNAKLEDTVFAEQKTGLMPPFTWNERMAPDMVEPEVFPDIGEGISIRPQQPNAQSFDAVHYGKTSTNVLGGSFYGTGLKGAEAERLSYSTDPRIKRRAYFYIPRPNGQMPKPEAGVGNQVHIQRLNNMLGPGPEMSALAKASVVDGRFNENVFESSVIDAGYDGYALPADGMAVVLDANVPVIPRGTRQEVEAKPEKDKIQIGDRKYSLRQTNTKEFKDWFGDSKIVNADSTPKVMYHGTARDIETFKPKQANAIFVTDKPRFAENFTDNSEIYMVRELFDKTFTPEQRLKMVRESANRLYKNKDIDRNIRDQAISRQTNTDSKLGTFSIDSNIEDDLISRLRDMLPTRANIMPLYVRAERPFDYENLENIERVINNLKDSNINTELLSYDLNKGNWEIIESSRVQKAIKDLGFDSFYVNEGGTKNLAVYDPNQIKSAIGNFGTFSRTNNDIRYSLALEGLKPSSALIPDEGGNPSGNLGFMPEKLGGKPIRLLVGTHSDTVDELVNEKMYRPVSYGGNHILNRIMSYPKREPIGAEELLEKIVRAAQKTSQTYTRIYKDGNRFILFDGKNSLILGENPDSMSIITMYTQTDPNRRYGNPAWFGRAPVVPEFAGLIRGTKVEAKEGRIAPSEVESKAKRVYTPSDIAAIAAGEPIKEPKKGTLSLGKKLSLRVPDTAAVQKFLQGSPASFDSETGDPLVFFRGQRRDAGPESFDIKTRATPSFTTNPHVASVYASRGLDTLPGEVESDWVYKGGSFLMPSFIQMKNPIDLRGYGNRPATLIDLFGDSGVDPAVFEEAPQDLLDVLDELAQLQYSTGFQSGGAFDSVEDALDAFRADISRIDPDSLEDRTEGAQEVVNNTVYGILENLRVDPFAFADSQKVLNLVNQYNPRADAFIVRDVMSETFAEKLAEKGQIDDDSGYDTYKPFEVNQVKSVFNFNPDIEKKDVRYSLAGAANVEAFGLTPTSAKDNAIYLLQDKNIDLKRVIQAIQKSGKDLADRWDAYLKEELFHGRSATRIKFFLDRELRPLLQKMNAANVSLEQMDDYLLARHAKEANAYIRKINPDPNQNSGMTDKEADDYMASLPAPRKQVLERFAKEIDGMTKETRKLMVDYGLEDQNTINQWEKTYKNYVPLFREEIEDGLPISIGRGYQIRGSTTRQRMGSSRKVVDVLANIALQRERTIVRGEKNRVGNALYGLILDNPNKGFWGVINPEKMSKQAMRIELLNLGINPDAVDEMVARPPKKTINKTTGLVGYEIPPMWKNAPNIFATRINGQDQFMIFNDKDERAMRMASTLKNLDAQQQGEAIRMMGTAGDYYRKSINGIGTVTRYFAQINTQYNPAFGIYNLMRDIGGAVLNLQTTPLKGQEAKVISDALIALKSVYRDLRRQRDGLDADSQWAKIFEEFELEGGKTGYRDLFETTESRAEALQKELDDFSKGKLKGSGKAVMGWLSDFNDAIENSVRVSVYKNAIDKGISKERAASLAKNITVNFNRTGAVSRNFQTLFAFFNASIQGTARIAQTLLTSEGKLSPTGKKIVMGGITLGVIQAALLAMAGLDDDDVPDFVKDKSFVIPYGDGKYFAVPMPLGYNIIPGFGRRVMEFAMSDDKNVGKAVVDTSSMIIDGFNPLGSATFVQTLTPTVLDPIVALAENRDFTGKPISRDDVNSLSPTPGYTRGSQNAFAITEALAYGINILTGGTEFKKGALSPTPDQIEYLVGEALGGVGREAMKIGRGIESIATGEELATYNVPIIGRLTGNIQQQAAQRSKFFDNVRRLNEHQAEIEGRLLKGEDINEYLNDFPEASMYQVGDRIYNRITKLRQMKKALEGAGAGKEELKAVDEAILGLMVSLNQIYDSAKQ